MIKKASPLVILAFPIGLIGSIVKSYAVKASGDTTFDEVGIGSWTLIGGVTAVGLAGFLLYSHFQLFAVPEDLFTGPMFGKSGSLFGGDPAIFRQGLVMVFVLVGCGAGFILSALIFKVDTLGIGISDLIPGATGSVLIISLWRRLHKTNAPTPSDARKDHNGNGNT